MNLANLITIGRLIAVPFIVWLLLSQNHATAFWLFVAAGVSDGIDGYLAKHWGMATALGRYLDPIADKALLVSIYATLGWQGHLPSWLVLMVVSRDLLIIGAILLSGMLGHAVEIRPAPVSKLNTVVQIGLVVWVLAHFAFDFSPVADTVTWILIWSVTVTVLLSLYRYLVIWLNGIADLEAGR
ncbi:CDP-alcohol phosphatidyltransferase [Zavarzinia compransoris]|uniref:CDP-diacylglycerol--glycerol-3-phosphate 3-phosphatidyltransferase n=1 Tax=Zavarzinia compransoris TaxID=1264899 RepID=A0A317EFX2_9PROT|nr:CDP-alcohol phosphatidyltransferase [Zavarzinia compransoris]